MMSAMRTTLNIDEPVLRRLRLASERDGTSFRETVNRVLRLGLERALPAEEQPEFVSPVFSMGAPSYPNMDKALQLAAMLEDEETLRDLNLRK
jgi:hypothetical protein